MPDGTFGPEILGMPQPAIGAHKEEGAESELIRLRRMQESLFVTEVIKDPATSPGLAREFLIHEVLFPSEFSGMEISRWEVNPTLREILRRAGENEELRRLTRILEKQDDAFVDISVEISAAAQGQGDEEGLKILKGKAAFLEQSRDKTEGIIKMRMRSSLFSEEAKDWFRLYEEMDAAVTLQEINLQREKAQQDVDVYADQLFKSNFFIATGSTSSLVALLEQEEFGPAIERAMRAYIDIHLTGQLNGKDVPKVAQEKDMPLEVKREQMYQAVRAVIDNDPFVAKRAEVIAKHLLETSLLSVWLGVPRNEKGEADYSKKDNTGKDVLAVLGNGRLEGSTPTDLQKLVLFRLKYWNELNKNYPSIAGGMARYLPEGLTPTLLHFMQTEQGKKAGKSVFDEWYFDKKPLAELLKQIPEDAISNWFYCMYRQNNCRNHLINFSRGGETDCISQISSVPALRAMKKDFDVGMGSSPILKETVKINMIACRIIAWSGGLNSEMTFSPEDIANLKDFIKSACLTSRFLSEGELQLVERVLKERKALTPEEVMSQYPQLVTVLLRENEPDRLTAVSGRALAREIEELKGSDAFLKGVEARLEEARVDGKTDSNKLKDVVGEEKRK